MSVPFNTIKCGTCNYSSWLLDRNGWKYYQLPNDEKLTIHSAWGWCYNCKELKAIETFPTLQSIEGKLHKYKSALSEVKDTGLPGKLLQLLGKDRFKIEQIYDRINNSENWLTFLKQRSSPTRCLTCSSTHIKPLDLPETKDYKGFMLNDFKHPDCGGTLWLRQNSFWLNAAYAPKSYDTEGMFLREDE